MRNPITEVSTPYNKKEILGHLEGFKVKRDRQGNVVTMIGNNVLNSWKASKKYEMVDFGSAVKSLLTVSEKIFDPCAYSLTIKPSFQELRLKGEKISINGDDHWSMVWLTNSTDGTRVLSVRYGLFRQICTNGAIGSVSGSSFAIKHLVSNDVNKELKSFMDALPKVNVNTQVKVLKALNNKEVTVRQVAKTLVEDIGKKGNETIWNQLVRKLVSSKTDNMKHLGKEFVDGIQKPYKELSKETLNTKMPAWKLFNCYTELWRSLDAGQIERETGKILDIISKQPIANR